MKTRSYAVILPFFLFMAMHGTGQPAKNEKASFPDSLTFFLYIEYCGSRFNKSIRRQELVINAVKLPAYLLKKMPRLRADEEYSSRNRRIYLKQQKFLKQYSGEKMIVQVNKGKFRAFYPKGLKKGIIIESGEFNRWNFMELPSPELPPKWEHKYYHIPWDWYETDPVNITYGLVITT